MINQHRWIILLPIFLVIVFLGFASPAEAIRLGPLEAVESEQENLEEKANQYWLDFCGDLCPDADSARQIGVPERVIDFWDFRPGEAPDNYVPVYNVRFDVKNHLADPVEGATVELENWGSEQTAANGRVVFEDVEYGTYNYSVVKDDHLSVHGELKVFRDPREEILLLPTFDLTLEILDGEDSPLVAAEIELQDFDTAVTDGSGQAIFHAVPVGEHNYTINKSGFFEKSGELQVDGPLTLQFVLSHFRLYFSTREDGLLNFSFEVEPGYEQSISWHVYGADGTLREIYTDTNFIQYDFADEVGEKQFYAQFNRPEAVVGLQGSANSIVDLPDEIGQLSKLEELYLSGNQIAQLPPGLGDLKQLRVLNLLDNNLTAIPPSLGQLESLVLLNLMDNELSSLPRQLRDLSALEHLELNANQLEEIPGWIDHLQALRSLLLRSNEIDEIPSSVGNLGQLEILNLMRNNLQEAPAFLGNLSSLQELNLRHNHIAQIPSTLGNLQNLTRLRLESNELTALPPELGQLENLYELDIHVNKIEQLPSELGSLTALEIISAGHNKITDLPSEISNWENIRHISLYENDLEEWGIDVVNWQQLEELELDHNNLSSSVVDEIFASLEDLINSTIADVNLQHNNRPGLAGDSSINNLQTAGWTIRHD